MCLLVRTLDVLYQFFIFWVFLLVLCSETWSAIGLFYLDASRAAVSVKLMVWLPCKAQHPALVP